VTDERFFELALLRLRKIMFGFGVAGTMAALAWRGWLWGAGFALGAGISWLNFRWLHQLVEGIGGKKIRKRIALLAAFRYLLLGLAAYVILRFSKISKMAAMAGLFIAAAAVAVEIVIELAYARK
jgi:hypothetical protein